MREEKLQLAAGRKTLQRERGFTIKDFKTKASLVKQREGGRVERKGLGGGGWIQDDTRSRLTLISGLEV